jgi:hypothetical protein
MGYTYDFFVGFLRCPICGVISDADQSTNMQTYIRDEPELSNLGVGYSLKVDLDNMRDSNYIPIQSPNLDSEICIIDMWECPSCGAPRNWAKIIVRDRIIQEVSSVSLTWEVLKQTHYISDECLHELTIMTELSCKDLAEANLLKVLQERL